MAVPVPPKSANSARPSSVGSPVPSEQDQMQKDLDAFMASRKSAELPAVDVAPPEDTYAPLDMAEADIPRGPQPPSVTEKVLNTVGGVADYTGGFVRSGLAEVAGIATGQPNTVTPEDLKKAAKGQAPTSEEYLRRLGVPEGGSFKVAGEKITMRGVAGFATDIATDPLTAITKLIKGAPYLKKLLTAPGKATEALGEAVYRSGFNKIDEKLVAKGGDKLSQTLIEQGAPIGTTNKIAKNVEAMSSTMGKMREGLYKRATELGVTIDTAYPMKRAEAVLAAMEKDPGLAPSAAELRQLLERYKSAGKVSIEDMSRWKTSLYDSLPASSFDAHGKVKNQAAKFKGALAADFRDAIVGAGNKAEKGLGDSIEALNSKWGTLLESQRPLAKQAAGAANQSSLGKMIDTTLLASGHGYALAGKKALELAGTTAARTTIGKALMELGKTDFMNKAVRQGAIAAQRPSPLIPLPPEPEEEQ